MPLLFHPLIMAFAVSAVATALLLYWYGNLRSPLRSTGTFAVLFSASCAAFFVLSEAQFSALDEHRLEMQVESVAEPQLSAEAPIDAPRDAANETDWTQDSLDQLLEQLSTNSNNAQDSGTVSAWTDDVAMMRPPAPAPAPTVSELQLASRQVCTESSGTPICFDKDDVLSSLPVADYAFNRPSKMTLGTPETIALVINSSGTANFEQEFQDMIGSITEGEVPVDAIMEAELVGPAFTIKPEGRQRRQLSTLNPTRWDWEVTPNRAGTHQLEVSMYVILTLAGEEISEDKPLAERQIIEVTVSALDRINQLLEDIEPLRAFIYTVVAGIAGILAWFGIKNWPGSHRKPSEENETELAESSAPNAEPARPVTKTEPASPKRANRQDETA